MQEHVGSFKQDPQLEEEVPEKVECPHCKQTPCCLVNGMKDLLVERGLEFASDRNLPNRSVRYRLYRCAARSFFGYLGWRNRKELPKCIIDQIRFLYPEGYAGDYTNFIRTAEFYHPENNY